MCILLVVYLIMLKYTFKMYYKIYLRWWQVYLDILYHIILTT